MPKNKKLKNNHRSKDTMLVFEPTAAKPWVGFYEIDREGDEPSLKKIWQDPVQTLGPGKVRYWDILDKRKKFFPASSILVVTGPGSFSYTRSAVNISNGLGFAWDVSVMGIDRDPQSNRHKKNIEALILEAILSSRETARFDLKIRATPFYL